MSDLTAISAHPPEHDHAAVDLDAYGALIVEFRGLQNALARAHPPAPVAKELARFVSQLSAQLNEFGVPLHERPFHRLDVESRDSLQCQTPSITMTEISQHQLLGTVVFEDFYHGSNGAVHGGALPLLLDEALGRLATHVAGGNARTAYLNVNYLAVTPINTSLDLRVTVERVEDRKHFLTVSLMHGTTTCCTADALFIKLREGQR